MVPNDSASRAEENRTLDKVDLADGIVKRQKKVRWITPVEISEPNDCRW